MGVSPFKACDPPLPYAINLRLDSESVEHVERLYGRLAGLDVHHQDLVTQYGVCVTILVIGDVLSPEFVARTLELRLRGLEALLIDLTEPCIILGAPPTLSLRVGPSEGLLSLHNALFSEFAEDDVHLHYRPSYWQPHLKLCNVRGNRTAADKLKAKFASDWQRRSAVLDVLEVMQYPPVQSVWQARLKQPSKLRRS